jgi:hypothetical protein
VKYCDGFSSGQFHRFLDACAVFVVMIIIYGVPIGINLVLFPLLVAIQILLTLGIVMAASAVMVTFRDIRFDSSWLAAWICRPRYLPAQPGSGAGAVFVAQPDGGSDRFVSAHR